MSNLQVFFVKPLFFSTFSLLYSLKKHNSIKREKKKSVMGNHQFIYPIFISFITTLGLVSISLCIAAEFKKTKKEDLRFDGKLCYLPKSVAFELGIGALICLIIGQVIGNLLICRNVFSKDHQNNLKTNKKPTIIGLICVISWMSFVMATILIGTSISMSKTQPLGEGWLDGECYIVNNGVYIISAILVFITLSTTLGPLIFKIRKKDQAQTS